jgi:hypothetical protein
VWVAVSVDGARVAGGGWGGAAAVWDAARGAELARHQLPLSWRARPAFAADGRLFGAVGPAHAFGPVTLYDLAAGQAVAGLAWPWPPAFRDVPLSVSPDGRSVAAAWAGLLRVWPTAGGETFLEGHAVSRGAFLPDGRLLTFHDEDGSLGLWPAELFRS